MTASKFSTTKIGWVAIATGVSAILAVTFILLMYAVDMSFGKVNDAFNSLIGILSATLTGMLYEEQHAKSRLMNQALIVLTVIGAIFTVVGSVLIIFGFTDFVLAGWYSGIGFALIGVCLAMISYSLLYDETWPQTLLVFGIVTGACMAIGLFGIPGILARIDTMDSMPWYLYVAFFGWLGTYILYPIWTIWLGRNLLRK
ncbi:MAG TPA: hypothetical protein VFQ23_01385 [Anaerolineales bacterium]|nr:hypothetical protein [Anaerolineales bacterium]